VTSLPQRHLNQSINLSLGDENLRVVNGKGINKTLQELILKGLMIRSSDRIKGVYHLTEAGRKVFETIKNARANLETSPQEVGKSSLPKIGG